MKFNPLIFSGFDFGGSSSGGAYIGFKPTVATGTDLPLVGNTAGDVRTTQDSGQVWVWDATATRWVDSGITTTISFGSTPNSVGYTLTLNNVGLNRIERNLELQPADATNPGLVSTTTQTFGGAKTFNSSLTVVGSTTLATSLSGPLKAASGVVSASAINLASEVTGTLPIANGGTSLTSTPTNGQLLIGNGTNYTLATITGTSNQVSVSNGSGSITLSTPQDIASASSPTFAGLTLTAFSGVVKASAGVLSASAVSLTADVSGVLPVANGGTNSSTALNNNRFVISSGGALVEHSAVTASRALASDTSGLPVAATTTSTELDYLSGVTSSVQTQLNSKIPSSEKGANNGVATLDSGGKIPVTQLPNSVMEYQGNWDASTNTPTLIDGTGNAGDVYRVNVAGTQDLGSGSITFAVGDWAVYSGSIWEKSLNSNAVTSVNGQTGVVVLSTTNISEGTNLYFTDERSQDAVGGILTNSTTISLTYNDGLNTIAADVNSLSLTNSEISTSAAIARSKLASGTASHVLINDGSGVMSSEATLSLSRGGTGLGTAPTNGQLLIGNGTTYTLATISGTSNQVSVTNGAGSITLATPQDIHSGASPTFAGLTLTGFSGFVKATAGVLGTSSISLTADVSGVLPVANGGTNSSTSLSNNRFIISSGGALVEQAAITANRALTSDASGLPTASATTDTELGYLSGVTSSVQTQINSKISSAEKGAANGVATLDSGSKIPAAQLPDEVMSYKGNWNASTNTPTLIDGTGNTGDIYKTSVGGTQDLGSGSIIFSVGDWVLYNGTVWEKAINSNSVTSVNGQTGAVVLTTTNIAEGTSLYFTDERAQDAVGGILTNTTTISLTYNDGLNTVAADVNSLSLTNSEISTSAAIARSKLASGTASHVLINDGSGVMSSEATLSLSRGGTGLASTPTNGQILIGNGTNYSLAAISGTTDQVTVTNGAGTITLSTPQSIATTSSPTFAGLTLTGFGGVVKASGGTLSASTIVNADINASAGIERSKIAAGTSNHIVINDGTGFLSSEATLAVSRGGTNLSSTPTNGQLLVGNGSGYTLATITAGTGISVTNGAGTITIASQGSTGDIAETSFTAADNQVSAANVTGFAFANGTVRSFTALVSIVRDTTYAQYTLTGIQKAASWNLDQSLLGDDIGLEFSITSGGQIQYTSTNTGSSATVKFRAITTTV